MIQGGLKMRNWLINRRKDKEMTQIAVASHVGISRAYYTQIELNQRSPSIRVAKNLAILLEFEWVRFFEDIRVL
jgi:putative transcriptional regulator